MGWVNELLPNEDQWTRFTTTLIDAKDKITDKFEMGKLFYWSIVHLYVEAMQIVLLINFVLLFINLFDFSSHINVANLSFIRFVQVCLFGKPHEDIEKEILI